MENTARKLTAQSIVEDFKSIGASELLKVFLVTGATDISKSYELVKSFHRNATSDIDKANFMDALKTLERIELKRIQLTGIVYGANKLTDTEIETAKEDKKTILMLPSLDETLDKVRAMFIDCSDITKAKDMAFLELKATVGSGKVMNSEKQAITWDDDHINQFIDKVVGPVTEEPISKDAIGFKTIFEHIADMANAGYDESKIKESVKLVLIDKVLATSKTDQFLIRGEKGFNDYYDRILSALVVAAIKDHENKKAEVGKADKIKEEIKAEVVPALTALDKDEKQSSFVSITKMIRKIYEKFGLNKSLSDSLTEAQELAETTAPNLLKRNKETKKTSVPTVPQPAVEIPVEIYDESHNIKETNKELYAEVEKYEYLSQIFNKAVELTKKGLWKDALSMSIILISSGKIKETEVSKDTLKWDNDQVHLWYHNVVEPAINSSVEITIDAKAEVVGTMGPVPKIGAIDSKEPSVRLLKDDSPYKGKYEFKTFIIKNDRGAHKALNIQIVDATPEQEPELLITEANLTKFIDSMRDHLVAKRNEQPWVKEQLFSRLSVYYDITGSEAKGMASNLVSEADVIRRGIKAAKKTEVATEKPAESVETKPVVEVPPTTPETPVAPTVPEVPATPETTPVVEEPKKESEVVASPPTENPVEESPETTTPTEKTSGEEATSSNDEQSFEGFEDIVKAKTKGELHVAIYKKASEFAKLEDGVKAVFEVINTARKDNRYKKSQIRNWKPTPKDELLGTIQKIVDKGVELSGQKQ